MNSRRATVCFPFVGSEVGGSHISALGLIRRLDRKRFRPIVALQHPDSQIGQLFGGNGLEVVPAPKSAILQSGKRFGPGQGARVLSSVIPLTQFLESLGADIVHTNDGGSHATWALPAKLSGAKLLWHHRGDPNAIGLRLVAPFLADRVVAVSSFASPRPGLISAARKTRVIYSPFNVDLTIDRAAARAVLMAELGCPPDTRVIGYFGSLIARKRPLVFVDAIAAIIRQERRVPVIGLLFGNSPGSAGAEVLGRVRALGIGEQIKLMGFRYPGSRWIAACDLLMVPAVDEPFGRTLIEAMLVGTPVVAADSGGNREALRHGETGLLAQADDAEALGAAATKLLDEPEFYRSISERAEANARSRFGEERHAAAIMELYDELLTTSRLHVDRG